MHHFLRAMISLLALTLAFIPADAARQIEAIISPEAAIAAVREIQPSAALPATNRIGRMAMPPMPPSTRL